MPQVWFVIFEILQRIHFRFIFYLIKPTAVEQTIACAPVTQQVRSPVGTSFLAEVFSGFFLTCKTNVKKF